MSFKHLMSRNHRSASTDPRDDPAYGDPDVFYDCFYDRMPCGDWRGLARFSHLTMERPFGPDREFGSVIEVGAGDGVHLRFVRHGFERYLLTDLRAASLERCRAAWGVDPRVGYAVADAEALGHTDASFDRVVVTCLLLHLPHPEQALAEWRRVVRPGGTISILVPNEGAALRFVRRLTTARTARRLGFNGYDLMLAREHINRSRAVDAQLRHVFRNDEVRTVGWPLSVGPMDTRLFTVYQITRID